MDVVLEKIIQDGFVFVDTFADLKIYKKDNARILYEPKTDKVYLTYNIKGDK